MKNRSVFFLLTLVHRHTLFFIVEAFAPLAPPLLVPASSPCRRRSLRCASVEETETATTTDGEAELARLRFGGVSRLYGPGGLGQLQRAHVTVIGVGGVGCWTAEALCRSGVGRISLVDLDELCISNTNRQLHAMSDTVGRPKTSVLAERLRQINPHCNVTEVRDFVCAENVDRTIDGLLAEGRGDAVSAGAGGSRGGRSPQGKGVAVVDAIDGVGDKAVLLATCRRRGVPLVVVGGAGGKRDPTRVRTADITCATNDMLLKQVRKLLRREHGFPKDLKGGTKRLQQHRQQQQQEQQSGVRSRQAPEELQPGDPWGVACVYSDEKAEAALLGDEEKSGSGGLVGCDGAFGTACFVTGAFGFAAAAATVEVLVKQQQVAEEDRVVEERSVVRSDYDGSDANDGDEDSWEMDCPCSDFDS